MGFRGGRERWGDRGKRPEEVRGYFVRNPTLAPQLEKTYKTPQSSGDEGLHFLHCLESNPVSSLQTPEEV